MTTELLREQANSLIDSIKALPEPERSTLLREVKARCAGSVASDKRSTTRQANIQALNAARKAQGVSDETRAKLREKAQATWAKRRAAQAAPEAEQPGGSAGQSD